MNENSSNQLITFSFDSSTRSLYLILQEDIVLLLCNVFENRY